MDESFLRRIRSLARTAPLHELEAGKVMRPGDWSAYDLRALCLAAIDTTIEHMGLEYGAPAGTIVRTLADVAARSAPDRPAEEHQRVATAVLEGLLNERDRRQAFTVSYADPTDQGNRHVLAFHLLREIEATNGTIVVRATTEAINLFVGLELHRAASLGTNYNGVVSRRALSNGNITLRNRWVPRQIAFLPW